MDEKIIGARLAAQLRRPGAKSEILRARLMAKAVQALRGGASFAEAAACARVARETLHRWRRASRAFDEACAAAVAESDQPKLVAPRGGAAKYQLQRSGRRHRFTAERKALYLSHFATTCDSKAAAAAAGVHVSTVYHHRRADADFAAECRRAKAESYEHLEAELVRLRLEALERMRRRGGDDPPELAEEEFDRALQLLREHRKTLAGRGGEGVARARWDFDKALDALEKKLRAFGVRVEQEEDADQAGEERHPGEGGELGPGSPGGSPRGPGFRRDDE